MPEKNFLRSFLILSAFGLCLYGCVGPTERGGAQPSPTVTPVPGKALIVFVRPRTYITLVDSARAPVFKANIGGLVPEAVGVDSDPEIIGIVNAKTMAAYQIEPGEHLFMVVGGENADFMTADVLPNKTYYVLILARPGRFRVLFSFKAVDKQEQGSKDFKEIIASSTWVAKTAETLDYAASNMRSIRSRQSQNYRQWTQKAESQRPRLLPEDGT